MPEFSASLQGSPGFDLLFRGIPHLLSENRLFAVFIYLTIARLSIDMSHPFKAPGALGWLNWKCLYNEIFDPIFSNIDKKSASEVHHIFAIARGAHVYYFTYVTYVFLLLIGLLVSALVTIDAVLVIGHLTGEIDWEGLFTRPSANGDLKTSISIYSEIMASAITALLGVFIFVSLTGRKTRALNDWIESLRS